MARQQRVERVREAIKEEVSDVLSKLKDPRIGFTTVTDVEVSRDLRHVKVFVSVYGSEEEKALTMEGLERATGHVRTEIGRRIRLHYTPEIRFVFDSSIEHGARINEVLRQLRENSSSRQPEVDDEGSE